MCAGDQGEVSIALWREGGMGRNEIRERGGRRCGADWVELLFCLLV